MILCDFIVLKITLVATFVIPNEKKQMASLS